MKLLIVCENRKFLGFLDFLPPGVQVEFAPEHLFRGPQGRTRWDLTKRAIWRVKYQDSIRTLCQKFDVVFCEFVTPWAAIVSEVSDRPVIVRLHRFEIDRPELLKAINWTNVTRLVLVSNYYASIAGQRIRAPISVVENGVDPERFSFQPAVTRQICTYSHHEARKRLYDLMLALREFTLHVGGSGEVTRILEEADRRFGLGHKLYGHVELPSWLRDKEFFIFHSMDESCGVSLLEAMSSGLLCLCHDYPASSEILPSEYRYVYNEELIRKLKEFLRMSPETRLEHKRLMRKIVMAKFDVRKQAEKFAQLFSEVSPS